ncbi:tetratricopeptide repeat protein [Pseudomonas sp. K1(2024)]|uniref:Tetratricopeptide repeat protein n=1 Tax=Pseudomonas boreofloridensis TaxID=3064348 RepID=A0ABV4Z2Q6_9PSED|nr:hypothetical protein [Pseudomonas sp. K13]MDO7900668.1 hypothetical protein [Pseudomonas sp. K13]
MSEAQISTLPNHLRDAVQFQLATEVDDDTSAYVAVQLGQYVQAGNHEAVSLLESLIAANKERAKIVLADLLATGDGIERDCPRSIKLLESAADSGSVRAMLMLCDHYDGRRDPADADPAKALHCLRRAADLGNETGAESLADRLVAGRSAEQCTPEEVAEIERLYQETHYTSNSYYKLAMFHSQGKQSNDYAGDEYRKAVTWLRKGKQRHEAGGKKCAEQLTAWGLDVPAKGAAPNSNEAKWAWIILPFSIALWAAIGSGLLAVANAINAVTIPLILIIAVIAAVISFFKRKR